MKREKFFEHILFWLTLISPMVAFALASAIGEADIFGVLGIVRYSWVMWLFIPVGALCLFVGCMLKRKRMRYKKNVIIACICLPLLLLFGSYRYVFDSVTYDADRVQAVASQIDLALPEDIKVATHDMGAYTVSYGKITEQESRAAFEKSLATHSLWQRELHPGIQYALPFDISYDVAMFDYFVFYNVTRQEYNAYPFDGECECVFIAYDCEQQRFILLDGYTVAVQ